MKIDWFDSKKYYFTDESVKRQITDSISENLTDSYLESVFIKINKESKKDNNCAYNTKLTSKIGTSVTIKLSLHNISNYFIRSTN